MPTNIAETIQRGTQQQNQQSQQVLQGVDKMGETVAGNAMKEAGMRLQMQENIDTKASAIMKGLELKQMNLSASNKGVEELLKMQEAAGGAGAEDTPEMQKLNEEIKSAMTKREAATIDRNDYLMSITGSAPIMSALKQASFMDSDMATKMFSPEFMESLSPTQKDTFVQRMTAIQEAERQMEERKMALLGQARSSGSGDLEGDAYARKKGTLLAEREFGEPEYASTPDKSTLTEIQYATNLVGLGKTKNWIENAYKTDVAKYYPRWNEIQDLPGDERQLLYTIMGGWDPNENSAPSDQDMAGFDEVLSNYEEKAQGKNLSPVTVELIESMRSITEAEDEPQLRLGAFINQMKNIVKPKEVKKPLMPSAGSY